MVSPLYIDRSLTSLALRSSASFDAMSPLDDDNIVRESAFLSLNVSGFCPSVSDCDYTKLEEGTIARFTAPSSEKQKKKGNKKSPKPPRPPRTSPLNAADEMLIKEISELVMLKRARMERVKALKKMKDSKQPSSIGNLLATAITIFFCLAIVFQGKPSRVLFLRDSSPTS